MKYLISKKGYKNLEKSLSEIDDEIIKTQRKMGESVKKDNDLRENPEFMDLRVKAMYTLPSEKENVIKMINNAIIIEDTAEFKNAENTAVYIGSTVKIDFDGEVEEFTILGSNEGDLTNNILSCDSPLAQKLINRKIGEEFYFRNMKIKILEITRALTL